MNYLIIYDEGHGYKGVYDFNNREEADAFLHDRIILNQNDSDDYILYEYTQTFNVSVAAKEYADSLDERRKAALNKLTDSDKIVLGIA